MTDYEAAAEHAVLFDVSDRSKIELTGRDRGTFLHNFCTNRIVAFGIHPALPAGSGCEAFLTTVQGKIVAHVWIFLQPESIWIDASPGLTDKILGHLDRYLITEEVVLTARTDALAQFRVTGPRAEGVLGQALGRAIAELNVLQHTTAAIAAVECQVRRTDFLGKAGFDVLCSLPEKDRVQRALVMAGAAPGGKDAYEALRIEAGTPEYGRDIDETNLPQEVGRDDRAISFTKGCYLGQETVERINALGHVNRRLVGLQLTGDSPGVPGAKLFRDGQEVGRVTSSAYSPRMQTAIALAYLRRGHQMPDTQVEVEAADGRRAAVVRQLPFV